MGIWLFIFLYVVFEAFDDEVDLVEVELSPVWELE